MRISDWSSDVCSSDLNYRRVDDRPFGGGPGMVMMIDPLRACIAAARAADQAPARVVYLSPQGRPLTQARVRELAAEIGRAPCRERGGRYVWIAVVAVSLKKKKI